MRILVYTFGLALFLGPQLLLGQEDSTVQQAYLTSELEPRKFDNSSWEKAIQGLDYTVEEQEVQEQEAEKKEKRGSNNYLVITIISILLGALFLAVIIAYAGGFIRLKNPKVEPGLSISLEEAEQNLFEADLPGLLQQAIQQQDYEASIRLYYLTCLRRLADQKHIRWKKEKTNGAYVRELSTTPLYKDFQNLTLLFDRLRYGGEDIDSAKYQRVEPYFIAFLTQLDSARSPAQKTNE